MRNSRIYLLFALALSVFQHNAKAQTMNMPGMENSAGYLSSGTSLEPRTTSESAPMVHRTYGNWAVMLHGNAVLVNTQQSGPRGRDKLFSVNWFMPMAVRQSGRNTVMFRTMVSLDPATVTKRRYPQLFQKGETAYGLPIVDAQHPHELIIELAGRYDFRFAERSQFFVYGGPVGEPALGPTAFPHRSSASENPVAVLGHHEQDSTHISNSVVTLGFIGGPLQLEASGFHGAEPAENRWNIDTGKIDSFAARLTLAPHRNFAGQFSIGRINEREALHPGVDAVRMTSSLHHNLPFSSGHVSSSLIWGRNKDIDHHGPRIFNSYTFESTVKFRNTNWAWTRIENVDRDRTLVAGETPAALEVEEDPIGRVQAYTFGYAKDLPLGGPHLNISLGAQATTYGMPDVLKPIYGNRPVSFSVLLRLRPRGNMMDHMRMMHRH